MHGDYNYGGLYGGNDILGGYTYTREECHKGNVLAFSWENIDVHGAGRSRDMAIPAGAIQIDCVGSMNSKIVAALSPEFASLEKFNRRTGMVIDWPDMKAPELSAKFWNALVVVLKAIATKRKKEKPDARVCVVVFCMGGHGRTGTALSILASLFGVVPESKCPVEFIREKYCKNAVESNVQLDYVEIVTGRKVTSTVGTKKYESYASYGSGVGFKGSGSGSSKGAGGKPDPFVGKGGKGAGKKEGTKTAATGQGAGTTGGGVASFLSGVARGIESLAGEAGVTGVDMKKGISNIIDLEMPLFGKKEGER